MAAAIAAFRKAEAEALDAAFELSSGEPGGTEPGRGRGSPPRMPGWKLAGRLSEMRER